MADSSRGLTSNNRSQPNQPVPVTNSASPEIITQFLANQGKQIDIERRNQEIQLKEIELGDTYAHAALKAQLDDRIDARRHERDMKKIGYRNWLIAGIVTVVAASGTLLGLVAYGQAVLAQEIVKTFGPPLAAAMAGAFGGYYGGIQKGREKAKDEAAEAAVQK